MLSLEASSHLPQSTTLPKSYRAATMAVNFYSCLTPAFVLSSVLQLVKSQKMHAKLVIVVETEKEKVLRKEFVFDHTKVIVLINVIVVFWGFFCFFMRDTGQFAILFYSQSSFPVSPEKRGLLSAASTNEEQTLRKA